MNSITVFKLKIARGWEPLADLAKLCRTATNAAVEDWLLRARKLKRQTKKQAAKNQKTGKPLSESTKIYHAMRAAAPTLRSNAVAMLAAQLNTNLASKVDWRRRGEFETKGAPPKRKDAIMQYEDRPPFTTQMQYPVHNRDIALHFGERYVITLQLADGPIELELSTKRLPAGKKKILLEVASGKRKLCCSRLLLKDDAWYWFLPVAFEAEQLNEDVTATLSPVIIGAEPEDLEDQAKRAEKLSRDRPFELVLPARRNPWGIGDGRYLLAQTTRIDQLRKQIGWRYRQRNGAGHGRKKIDAAMSKRATQLRNITSEVRRRAIADVVRQCQRAGVGTLVYRDPTGPTKDLTWFAARGLEWDWTRWMGDLKNACARAGIAVESAKLKKAEAA